MATDDDGPGRQHGPAGLPGEQAAVFTMPSHELWPKFEDALDHAHRLPPMDGIADAERLAAFALRLRGDAARMKTSAVVELVEEHGVEATARLIGITERSVRRHAPVGPAGRGTTGGNGGD